MNKTVSVQCMCMCVYTPVHVFACTHAWPCVCACALCWCTCVHVFELCVHTVCECVHVCLPAQASQRTCGDAWTRRRHQVFLCLFQSLVRNERARKQRGPCALPDPTRPAQRSPFPGVAQPHGPRWYLFPQVRATVRTAHRCLV